MLVELDQADTVDHFGFNVTLKSLSLKAHRLSFFLLISNEGDVPVQDLSLLLTSGSFTCVCLPKLRNGFYVFEGDFATNKLSLEVSFVLCCDNKQSPFIHLRLHPSAHDRSTQWSGFFSGQLPKLPNTKLVDVATRLLRSAKIVNTLKPTEKFLDFCQLLSSPDFVIRMARLRHLGRFPSISSGVDGVVISSRLVLNWNILLIQEDVQRF